MWSQNALLGPNRGISGREAPFQTKFFSKVVEIAPSRLLAAFSADREGAKNARRGRERKDGRRRRESGKTGRIRGRRIEEPNAEITNACTASSRGEKQPACATATSRTNTRAESQRKRVSRAPDPLEELGLLPLERRRSRTKPSPETASDAHCDPRHLIDASPYPRRSARKAHNPPPCGSRAPHPSPETSSYMHA